MKSTADLLRLSSIALIGFASISLLGQPAVAQGSIIPPLDGGSSTYDNPDPFFGDGSGQSGIFNLIHRMRLQNDRSAAEFNRDQAENLTNEALEFRARQQELLQQESDSSPPSLTP